MVYVALLRGINVGGKSKVDMKLLKQTFERLGLTNVKTYINSGNVIFTSAQVNEADLTAQISAAIADDFGFQVPIIVRNLKEMQKAITALPDSWTNDQAMKCDVMFLWPEIDKPSILKQVPFNPDIEDVKYMPGALFWRIDRENVGRGKMLKIIGTAPYKQMTVRNCNTVRKLYQLMLTIDD